MKELVEAVAVRLKRLSLTVSVAESITGGLISKLLTDSPGSSLYFRGAVVAYSDMVKEKLLSIPKNYLGDKVVSEDVAYLLAKNVSELFLTDIGIGITGIAGPGTIGDLSVGLVYCCIYINGRSISKVWNLNGERTTIREESAYLTLKALHKLLSEE